MAASYANVSPAFAQAHALTAAPDGTHFKTFEAATLKELHDQMDETREAVHSAGGEEVHRSKIGRNAKCWCGSGLKFKKCHLGK